MEGQIWNKSFKNCRNEINWRMILAVVNTIYTIVQGSLKKFRTSMGFEPVTSRYRCDALTNWAMKPLMLGTHKSLKTRFNLILFPLITSTQVMNSQPWKINITTLTILEPCTVFQFFKQSKISFELQQCESWSWFLSSSYYCSSCRLSESICLESHQ